MSVESSSKHSLNRVFSGEADRPPFQLISVPPPLPSSSSPGSILMTIVDEAYFTAICAEGFFYGKICALTCTLAKVVQLFLGLGLYSGIFVMYLQCPPKKSGRAFILYYAVSLLYILSTATFVSNLVALILEVSNNSNL